MAADVLPWDPLESWRRSLGARWLCRELGVTLVTLARWQSAGVPADRADDIARALATDPTVDATWLWEESPQPVPQP